MTQDLYEVAFSGQIADGADPDQVKANIARMFKADDAKIQQLFSGARMVIKKNIDLQTAEKYRAALHNAGAICELVSLAAATPVATPVSEAVTQPAPAAPAPAPATSVSAHHPVPPAPQTVPLNVNAEQIAELQASLAPVGSDVQDIRDKPAPPPPDTSGLSMAPPGTDLGTHQEKKAAPIPDTSSLKLVDN